MLKNIFSLLLGSAGAQLVALLAAPLITRIYLPEEFGMMATVWAVIGLGGVVSCFAYERTIVLEHDKSDAQNLAVMCFYMVLFSAASVSCLIYFFEFFIYDKYVAIDYVVFFVFVGVLLFGIQKTLDFYATREKKFYLIAISILSGSIFGVLWKIVIGVWWGATAEVLLLGNLLGVAVPVILLWLCAGKGLQYKGRVDWPNRVGLLRRYSDFPKKQMPNAMLNALQQQAPVFLLATYFSPEIVGFYGLATMVLLRPVSALSNAVSRVYLQRISRLAHEEVYNDLIRVTITLALLAAPGCALLFVFGESLFTLLFGEKWADAGYMASLLAPWVLMVVAKVPTTQVLIVRRELRYILVFNIIYLIVRVSALVVSIHITQDVFMAILVFSLVGFVANIIYVRRGIVVTKHA